MPVPLDGRLLLASAGLALLAVLPRIEGIRRKGNTMHTSTQAAPIHIALPIDMAAVVAAVDAAWRRDFTAKRALARIHMGSLEEDDQQDYFVADNGAGSIRGMRRGCSRRSSGCVALRIFPGRGSGWPSWRGPSRGIRGGPERRGLRARGLLLLHAGVEGGKRLRLRV